jgi:hypothetical protein
MLLAFQLMVVHRNQKLARLGLRVFKCIGATLRNLLSNRSKKSESTLFELASFQKEAVGKNALGATQLRTY